MKTRVIRKYPRDELLEQDGRRIPNRIVFAPRIPDAEFFGTAVGQYRQALSIVRFALLREVRANEKRFTPDEFYCLESIIKNRLPPTRFPNPAGFISALVEDAEKWGIVQERNIDFALLLQKIRGLDYMAAWALIDTCNTAWRLDARKEPFWTLAWRQRAYTRKDENGAFIKALPRDIDPMDVF